MTDCKTVGVPDIAQSVIPILSPAGIEGEIVQEVGVPPEIVGVKVLIAAFSRRISWGTAYTILPGAVVPP